MERIKIEQTVIWRNEYNTNCSIRIFFAGINQLTRCRFQPPLWREYTIKLFNNANWFYFRIDTDRYKAVYCSIKYLRTPLIPGQFQSRRFYYWWRTDDSLSIWKTRSIERADVERISEKGGCEEQQADNFI